MGSSSRPGSYGPLHRRPRKPWKTLGSPRPAGPGARSLLRAPTQLAPIVAESRREGTTSWYGIAMAPNKRGVPTVSGRGIWNPGRLRRAGTPRWAPDRRVGASDDRGGSTLGAAGTHPYLVGVSEARAVIDSVRAARSISGTDGGNRYAAWGHSQGGQAALFSGLIADSYAPELNLVGVAAAAPATNLITLISDDFKSRGGKNLTAMTLWSWSRVFGAPIDRVVELAAVPNVDRLAEQCIESVFDFVIRQRTERPLEQNFLTVRDLAEVESWQLAINPIFASDPDAVDRWHVITTEVVERASADLTARPSPVIGRGVGRERPKIARKVVENHCPFFGSDVHSITGDHLLDGGGPFKSAYACGSSSCWARRRSS
jgi:Secretory lipase